MMHTNEMGLRKRELCSDNENQPVAAFLEQISVQWMQYASEL